MRPAPKISQLVSVSIDRWDGGLQEMIRKAVGAPRSATVFFDETGVVVRWRRRKGIRP